METWNPNGFRLDHTPEEIKATMDSFPQLEAGYDTAAIESYAIFRQLREEGVIGKGVRFQLRLPTPTQFLGIHIQPAFQGLVEPHYEAALLRSIREIQSNIPHEDLAIQLDLCMEYGYLNNAWWQDDVLAPIVYLPMDDKVALKKALLQRIVTPVDAVEEDVELAFMCYGTATAGHLSWYGLTRSRRSQKMKFHSAA